MCGLRNNSMTSIYESREARFCSRCSQLTREMLEELMLKCSVHGYSVPSSLTLTRSKNTAMIVLFATSFTRRRQ